MTKKNKTVALILCILLGYLGVHRFYVGKTKTGILYLLTCGLCGIGWIVDIILICTDKFSLASTSSTVVYIAASGNGKKYHYYPNCNQASRKVKRISLKKARKLGYTECSTCCPPIR